MCAFFIGAVFAAGDKKEGDSTKTKRAYSLGYAYDHDIIDHAPIVAHAPITTVHHAPIVAAAPIVKTAPYYAAAPLAKVTSSVVSTNVHHYPSAYVAHAAPLVAPAAYHATAYHPAAYHAAAYHPAAAYHAPIVAAPYSTIYHR